MKRLNRCFLLSLPTLVVLTFLSTLSGAAGQQSTKPKLRVASDGLPSGHDTPEGAACDLARAFIARDDKLFASTSIRLYGGGAGREAYSKFLQQTAENISQKTMLSVLVGIVVRCAIVVGVAFILSKTVPRNRVSRFVFLFALCVPLNFVINYVDVSFLGYHKMGWPGAFIIALPFAIFGAFWPPQTHNSNTS